MQAQQGNISAIKKKLACANKSESLVGMEHIGTCWNLLLTSMWLNDVPSN